MAALSQKAELNRACFSVLFCSEFGQEQSFEQSNIGREFASFTNVIGSIEDPMVIRKILAHLDDKARSATTGPLPKCRAPQLGQKPQ
jgi:hypothetical protein